MVFTVAPRSILGECPLLNSMEPFRGLERASRPIPQVDKLHIKKVIKNLNRDKFKSLTQAECRLSSLHPLGRRQSKAENPQP